MGPLAELSEFSVRNKASFEARDSSDGDTERCCCRLLIGARPEGRHKRGPW